MEVQAKKDDSANISAKVRVSKGYIDKLSDKIVREQAKNMNVAGFRKGKVPASVAKARMGDELKKAIHQEALGEGYRKLLEDLDIKSENIVGEPRVPKFDEIDGGIDAEIKCDLRPVLNLDGYKDLIPEITKPTVTDQEVSDRVNTVLKSVTKEKKVEGRDTLEDKDFALIDFEGFIDDKAFEGGKGEAYTLEIGSGSFIAGFEEQLIGMKIDEEKDINVTFPTSYASKELAGKESIFKVKLLEISVKNIPTELDEQTAKKLMPDVENGDMAKFIEQVKTQIENEKLNMLLQDEIKDIYTDALIQNFKIDVPQGIVEQEVNMSLQNSLKSLSQEELKYYSDAKKIEEKKAELLEDAINSVKLTFIVDELAKLNKITAEDEEVKQIIMYEAYHAGQDPMESLKKYEENNMLPAVKMSIIEQKLFDTLFREKLKAQ